MFKQYIAQVMLNAKAMANALLKKGYTLVSGTECFLCVLFLHKTNKHIKSKLISFFFSLTMELDLASEVLLHFYHSLYVMQLPSGSLSICSELICILLL